eukprot:511107-Pleurochrysis_carterae.AAC.1
MSSATLRRMTSGPPPAQVAQAGGASASGGTVPHALHFHAASIAGHLDHHQPFSFAVHTDAPTALSEEFTQWCTHNNGTLSTRETDPVDICLLDRADFNKEAPVAGALATASAFQSLVLAPKGLLLVGHCQEGDAGMDMMLRPQLQLMHATQVYRDAYAVWQLA